MRILSKTRILTGIPIDLRTIRQKKQRFEDGLRAVYRNTAQNSNSAAFSMRILLKTRILAGIPIDLRTI